MTDQLFTCVSCGGQFTGRKRMYCTKKCRGKFHSYKKSRKQGRRLREEITDAAACNQVHECAWCKSMFSPKRAGRTKYCSRECFFEFASAKTKLLSEFSASHKVHRAKCVICGGRFDGKVGSLYCGDDCRNIFYSIRSKRDRKSLHIPRSFSCKECANIVTTLYGDQRKVFCSDSCLKRHTKRIRRKMERARLRSVKVEAVDPIKVFNRDGWRCQICGKKTLKAKRGSIHERAPELDHIVPLSVGGEHSYANTQCACRQCNRRKGNTVYGQLPLLTT